MLDDLFPFPTVMVDGQNEEKKISEKERLGLQSDDEEKELDIVFGEAEYPYYDFVGIEDRWIPNRESFEKALKGRFNGCLVKFANIGHLLVPWTKKKFKAELVKFMEEREKVKTEIEGNKKTTIINFTPELLGKIIEKADEQDNNED